MQGPSETPSTGAVERSRDLAPGAAGMEVGRSRSVGGSARRFVVPGTVRFRGRVFFSPALTGMPKGTVVKVWWDSCRSELLVSAGEPGVRHVAREVHVDRPVRSGPDVLAPLVAHALAVGASAQAADVSAALRGAGGVAEFGQLVDAVGGRAAARFGVLHLSGTGEARVLTPGYLTSRTLVEAVA